MGLKIDIRNFYNDYLPGSYSALLTVPAGYRYVLKSIILRSEEATEKAISVKVRRSGKLAVLSPAILKELHTWMIDDPVTLESGDAILANTEAGAHVTCKISGVQEQV